MEEKMNNISYFQNFGGESEAISLDYMLDLIKSEKFKDQIEELRKCDKHDGSFGELKSKLPHFTPSGLYGKQRRSEYLIEYNPVIVLDIDHVGNDAEIIRDKAGFVEYTIASFVSPSGHGVKILVAADSNKESHETTYLEIADYYSEVLDLDIDRSGKDVTRACFISYDPGLFYNPNAEVFSTQMSNPIIKYSESDMTIGPSELFRYTVDFTRKVESYFPGNRNNFIYLLANNLNRAGMEMGIAEGYILDTFNDADITSEIPQTVKSAYSNTDEHGVLKPEYVKTASFAMPASLSTGENSPLIPVDVYNNLPAILAECTKVFELPREKDIFLTGALAILSGCFDNVSGLYDRRRFHTNLYCFVIAPPASGKGVLNYARELAQRIHDGLGDQLRIGGDERIQKAHFIPADSSSAAVKRLLKMNSGMGTICETEADTLSATLQQDWGGYDDLMRKSFQHESVTFSRADDKDAVKLSEIKKPKLSVCLSGTPGQVPTLLRSAENGLFSRFLFYTFRQEGVPVFKNVFAESGSNNLDEYFSGLSSEIHSYYQKVLEFGEMTFQLSSTQKEKFVHLFDAHLKKLNAQFGEETNGIVFRLGLITFRVAMLLSILRKLEGNSLEAEIECTDTDFQTSILLSNVYLEHSLLVFGSLGKQKKINSTALKLLEFLPQDFSLSEAVKTGRIVCDIKERSISTYLKDLVQAGYLDQPKTNGPYCKKGMQ